MKKPTDEDGFALVLTKITRAELARRLGIARQNLTRWKKVPVARVNDVAELTGIPRETILPSVYS